MKTNEKGITLITLVVTIVILLILAGIAIASLTGNNGLFTRANQARTNTLDTQNKENTTLEGYEDTINKVIAGTTIPGIDTDITNPIEAMPTGAIVIEGDANEGIVIRDENGNEWVWVEVPRTTEVYPNAGINLDTDNITDTECNTIYSDLVKYTLAYRSSSYSDTFYSAEQADFTNATEYDTAKNNMLKSIYKYGGFWIGRYEVGDVDATESNTTRTNSTGTSNKAVIKANQIPYNYVSCKEAQELSTSLSTGGKTGSLMFGIQWELTCKFLEIKGGLTQAEIKGGDGIGSTDWGNYNNSSITILRGKFNATPDIATSQWSDTIQGKKNSTILLTTGVSEEAKKMNIYDFAGNVWEWTLETNTSDNTIPCGYRGGVCFLSGSNVPAYIHGSNTSLLRQRRCWL